MLSSATAESRQHVLPTGSPVVFVSDGHLDVGAKTGSSVKVHLRDDLVVDGTSIAPAGTPARLVVGGSVTSAGMRQALISLDEFVTKSGRLPIGPAVTSIPRIDVGTVIQAKTLATVDHLGNRFSIEVPFPFPLSNDVPVSQYTPTPAKTAPPHPVGRPTPRRTPAPAGSAGPSASDNPNASPSPAVETPYPVGTAGPAAAAAPTPAKSPGA